MKKLSIFVAALPTTAIAHSGDHSQADPSHLLTEADHLAVMALIVALGVVLWAWRRGRS